MEIVQNAFPCILLHISKLNLQFLQYASEVKYVFLMRLKLRWNIFVHDNVVNLVWYCLLQPFSSAYLNCNANLCCCDPDLEVRQRVKAFLSVRLKLIFLPFCKPNIGVPRCAQSPHWGKDDLHGKSCCKAAVRFVHCVAFDHEWCLHVERGLSNSNSNYYSADSQSIVLFSALRHCAFIWECINTIWVWWSWSHWLVERTREKCGLY